MPNNEALTNFSVTPPAPTPEQIRGWEQARAQRDAATIAPYAEIKVQVDSADAYLLELDYRTCLLELDGGVAK
ncbi:MAG: hypothetical protein RSA12_04770 [Clostridia bacterium]